MKGCLALVFAMLLLAALYSPVLTTGVRAQEHAGESIGQQSLIRVAKASAAEAGIDVSDCTVSVSQEGGLTVVKFQPEGLRAGGGGKIYLAKKDGRYVFVKGELFQ